MIETPDGLPYIGKMADHRTAATGFGGNGMTFGTLAGIMIADAIQGRQNPWVDLFDPDRAAIRRGLWDYIKENADYPYYKARGPSKGRVDRFAQSSEARAPSLTTMAQRSPSTGRSRLADAAFGSVYTQELHRRLERC